MICPACGKNLQEMTVDDITVNVCRGGCGGIWFDNFELKKFDEPHESGGESLLNIEIDQGVRVDHSKRRNCPLCDNIVMQRNFFSVKRQVEVDTCPGCAGIWLDTGELGKIRQLFPSEADRRQAAQQHFSELFDKELAAVKAEGQDKLARSRRISQIFRWICPSYYIPGKQAGGAF